MSESSDNDIIEEIPTTENKSNAKPIQFTGALSFLNATSKPKKIIPEPQLVDITTFPANTQQALNPNQLSVFYQTESSSNDFLFGPLTMDAESDPFYGNFPITQSILRLFHSGMKAILFCVYNDEYSWPVHFTIYINHHSFSKPNTIYSPSSSHFYIDVTKSLILNSNSIHISLNSSLLGQYILAIKLFSAPSNTELVMKVLGRPFFTFKDHWTAYFLSEKAEDDSVDSKTFSLSLICPLSLKRIHDPIRGIECQHLLCFDLDFYLRFTRDCGKWQCPICDKNCSYDSLHVDEFIKFILNSVPENCESVEIDEEGHFKPIRFAIEDEDDNE